MSDQQKILTKAIQKAIDGGWKFQPFPDKYFPDYLSATGLVSHIAMTVNDLRLNAVIFNYTKGSPKPSFNGANFADFSNWLEAKVEARRLMQEES
jgi:hypothetical protein